jgi:predicted membrane protein
MPEEFKKFLTQDILNQNLDITTAIIGFSLAFLLSLILSLIYKYVNREREKHHIMMQTLILLSITISVAMMIIGNELARAFGLVGAVSIIRFRTVVKSSKDMAFVFISIIIGMACGLGFYILVGVFTFFIAIILLLMEFLKIFGFKAHRKKHYLLNLRYEKGLLTRKDLEEEFANASITWSFIGLKTGKKLFTLKYKIWVYELEKLELFTSSLHSKYNNENGLIITIDSISVG